MIRNKQQYHGQSLVESVVTLGVVVLLVTGLIVGTTSSLRYAENSRSRSRATQYAQEGIELARKERDAGWIAFARTGMFCVDRSGAIPSDPCELIDNRFTRELRYEYDVGNMNVNVQSSVSWIEGGATKNITLQTTLTDWK
ncbi:MAG: hypothetical protein V1917_03025 [Candidatus Gottesmanbacteria bacterium]